MKASSACLAIVLIVFSCKKKDSPATTSAGTNVGVISINQTADQIPADSPVGRLKLSLQDAADCPTFQSLKLSSESVSILISDLGGQHPICKIKLKITVPAKSTAQINLNLKNPVKMLLNLGPNDSASFHISQDFIEPDSLRPQGSGLLIKTANLDGPLQTTASYALQVEGTQPSTTTCLPTEQTLHLALTAQLSLNKKDMTAASEAHLLDGYLPLLQLALKSCL